MGTYQVFRDFFFNFKRNNNIRHIKLFLIVYFRISAAACKNVNKDEVEIHTFIFFFLFFGLEV